MKKFTKTLKRYLLWWFILAIAIALFGSLAFGEIRHWLSLKGEIARTEESIEMIEESVGELSEELTLISDPAYLEKEARRNLNVKREGEEVLIVVGLDKVKQEEDFSLVQTVRIEREHYMWENIKSWWDYFFK